MTNKGKKKLMLLGGLRYLLPVIETAQQMNMYVITVDYVPDNIAHCYSDEYHNISIIDKESVLQLAQDLNIDGIMSFAVDPGVITASYVQEKMGLPSFGPYESVCILQNKNRFREFLSANGFNVPWCLSFGNKEDALGSNQVKYPCIVKPTDSAGSKGVSRVNAPNELNTALEYAFVNSISKHIVIEEFIEQDGFSSDSECFSQNGNLIYSSFSSQRFDISAVNPYTPSAFSWPSSMSKVQEQYLHGELQRLLKLLQMDTSIYNVESRIGKNGKPYIMEVSPRGGGNRLAEMLRYVYDVDLIKASVCAAVGLPIPKITDNSETGHWAEIILHADSEGLLDRVTINDKLVGASVIECDIWKKKGDIVSAFKGANNSIGTLIVRFPSKEMCDYALDNIEKWIKVIVK